MPKEGIFAYYSDTMANMIATTVPFRFMEVPLPPEKPEPTDSTHRFYLCRPSTERKDVMRCKRKTREEAQERLEQAGSNKVVAIHAGYPQILDQIILSGQLKSPVALG